MPSRRAETSQESRRLLIEAAATAFANRGYRQTTVADIADLAGISRGSIPWHFGNKEGLLLAVVEHAFDLVARNTAEPRRPGPDGLRDLTDQSAAFVRQPITKLMISLLGDAMDQESPVHDRYVELHRAMRAHIAAWAEQPYEGYRLPDGVTPEDIGLVVLGATMGIHQQWRLAPDRVDLDRAFDTLRRLLLASFQRQEP
ncbi:TetR family transcriptional regulator [Amycolatopsis sp. YIM 10]|uniref:TetR family transcriptional regulator n=1 Tax=Amycolatopsis sp. YIM 10 TaxID=2653857 RepID=UPI00129055CB|nr:TetR family transcriptional regulator [Amycolatopsis sp. YIM 10]QFU86843.1 HTH-type transcriptional regulator TtgR [Amycolatopsis sp. YIM 10]